MTHPLLYYFHSLNSNTKSFSQSPLLNDTTKSNPALKIECHHIATLICLAAAVTLSSDRHGGDYFRPYSRMLCF